MPPSEASAGRHPPQTTGKTKVCRPSPRGGTSRLMAAFRRHLEVTGRSPGPAASGSCRSVVAQVAGPPIPRWQKLLPLDHLRDTSATLDDRRPARSALDTASPPPGRAANSRMGKGKSAAQLPARQLLPVSHVQAPRHRPITHHPHSSSVRNSNSSSCSSSDCGPLTRAARHAPQRTRTEQGERALPLGQHAAHPDPVGEEVSQQGSDTHGKC